MAPKPQVAVERRPDGRWAVQADGTQRAHSLHDKKAKQFRAAASSPEISERSP
jgi:hypothetical protein